jgi:nucleotide-binding universal stress UspA family protein
MGVKELEEQINVMLIDKTKAAFDDISKSLNKVNTGIKISFVSKRGSPSNEILKTIEEDGVDLVVMGTSGKKDFDVLLLGSVAEKVVRNAKCTVTIVH